MATPGGILKAGQTRVKESHAGSEVQVQGKGQDREQEGRDTGERCFGWPTPAGRAIAKGLRKRRARHAQRVQRARSKETAHPFAGHRGAWGQNA